MMGPRGGGPGGPGGPGRPPMRAGMGPFGGGMLPPEKAKDARRTFGRLLLTLRPELWRIVLVIAFAVVSVALAVLGPRILGDATNLIFEGVVGKQLGDAGIPAGTTPAQLDAMLRAAGQTQIADMLSTMHVIPGVGIDFGALAQILLLATGVYVLSSVFSGLQSWIMAGVSQRTVYRLRGDVDQKMARLPLRYFDSHQRGDTLSRMTNDIDNISTSLQQTMTQLINAVCTIVGVLVMMLLISPLLAVVSLLTVPISIAITIAIAKRSQKQFAAQWAQTGALNGHIEEMHTGHAIVKAFGRQDEAIEEFETKNAALYGASRRAQFLSGTIQPALQFVANLNYVAICVIGGLQVASGQLSLGDVQAFVQYSRMFTMPITQTATIANVIQSAIASAERVFELLDEPEEVADPAEPVRLPTPTGRVAFDDISFRYVADQPLMEHLDLTVEPGHTVAIVGPTGAGKTTLVNLLLRFYDVDEGAITVDGVDIRSLTRDDLRSMFGMVLQDTWLFHGTIRENIAYGDPTASEERILAAAADAHVDHFVRTLPDGYDTVIDDEATNVSAGEKQLLTIARAFLADPRILILDEATSSVDTRTEVLIQRAMARLMEGRTSFVIAHRLSTIRDADTILVMDHGRIVEQGTHQALLAKGGFYADLYESQFGEPLEAAS